MANAGRGAAAGLCPNRRIAEAAFLAAALGIMASLHLVLFGLPMLNPDESSWLIMGLTLFSGPGSAGHDYVMANMMGHLGPFPVQYSPYIGTLGSYTSLPFSYALGPSVEAIRAYNMFVVLVLQLALYATTRELFSRTPAMMATAAFSAFPFVIFFSRQSSMYDWIILPITLFVLWAGVRFVRGGSLWHLAAAVLSCWLIIWAYLYSVWPVLGMLAALPFCIASFRKRRPGIRRAFLWALVLGLAGFAPFAAHYAAGSGSLLSFLADVVNEDTPYLRPDTDNADVLSNLSVRSGHLWDLLTGPATGFDFAKAYYMDWSPFNPAFAVLLAAGAAAAGMDMYERRPGWGRFAGLLAVIFTIVVVSAFTVTTLRPIQLGIMLPFAFALIGGGLGRATARLAGAGRLKKAGLRQAHLAAIIIGATIASQAPHVYEGFVQMRDEPGSGYMQAADELGASLDGYVPVAMDWWTYKSLFIMLDGRHVPYHAHGPWEAREFNPEVRKELGAHQSPVPLENSAFVLYMYPYELDCTGDLSPSDMPRSNQCAEAYFVESAADRAGLAVEAADFDLPDGTPYYRVLYVSQAGG